MKTESRPRQKIQFNVGSCCADFVSIFLERIRWCRNPQANLHFCLCYKPLWYISIFHQAFASTMAKKWFCTICLLTCYMCIVSCAAFLCKKIVSTQTRPFYYYLRFFLTLSKKIEWRLFIVRNYVTRVFRVTVVRWSRLVSRKKRSCGSCWEEKKPNVRILAFFIDWVELTISPHVICRISVDIRKTQRVSESFLCTT